MSKAAPELLTASEQDQLSTLLAKDFLRSVYEYQQIWKKRDSVMDDIRRATIRLKAIQMLLAADGVTVELPVEPT